MASILNETVGSAKDAMESAKEGTQHAYASTRSMVMDGVHVLAGIMPILRSFSYDGMLSRVGLERRRSPFEGAALFGAGMVVGAGIGVFFAPMSGERLRQKLFSTLKKDANEAVDRVEAGVKQVEEKAEDIADKAKNAAMKVERKIERKIDDGTAAVEGAAKHGADAVKSGADAAAGALKHAAQDAKSMVSSAANGTNGANGANDDAKTPKAQREGAHRSS